MLYECYNFPEAAVQEGPVDEVPGDRAASPGEDDLPIPGLYDGGEEELALLLCDAELGLERPVAIPLAEPNWELLASGRNNFDPVLCGWEAPKVDVAVTAESPGISPRLGLSPALEEPEWPWPEAIEGWKATEEEVRRTADEAPNRPLASRPIVEGEDMRSLPPITEPEARNLQRGFPPTPPAEENRPSAEAAPNALARPTETLDVVASQQPDQPRHRSRPSHRRPDSTSISGGRRGTAGRGGRHCCRMARRPA
ncbi:uncharacterized protein LOC122320114 [Drosophila ficusphila]|uniref:uncharacterized protein LOC122320114 n=1 Tax=Drosophila ficusphila TaxID=30025 RepID=UPI001C8B0854|nr:uncharacterized protein LOC122320114 [Drosophila ficusphila]